MAKTLIYWTEENKYSVINILGVQEPRKELHLYGLEFVRATYAGSKGKTYPGLLVAISDDKSKLTQIGVDFDEALSTSSTLREALEIIGISASHLDERADAQLHPAELHPAGPGKESSSGADSMATAPARPKGRKPGKKSVNTIKTSMPVQTKKKKDKEPTALDSEKQQKLQTHKNQLLAMGNFMNSTQVTDPFSTDVVQDANTLLSSSITPLRSTTRKLPMREITSTKRVLVVPASPRPRSVYTSSSRPNNTSPASPSPHVFSSPASSPSLTDCTSPASPPLPPHFQRTSAIVHAVSPHPTQAMKAPRKRRLDLGTGNKGDPEQPEPNCQHCTTAGRTISELRSKLHNQDTQIQQLQEEKRKLQEELRQATEDSILHAVSADVQSHNDRGPLRPGFHSAKSAAEHNMVELFVGSGVYIYPSNLLGAKRKSGGEAKARFLISIFYTTNELVEAGNLSGTNGQKGLDPIIINAIVAYTIQEDDSMTASRIKMVLRSKMSALISHSRKRTPKKTAL